jgi:hypothetical protein
MHLKTIANDRFSSRLMEAEAYRLTKTNQRSLSMVKTIGKAGKAVRNVVLALLTGKSLVINDQKILS